MLIKKPRLPIKEIILFGFLPSFLKKMIYKLKGYKIGNNFSAGIGSVILGEDVSIGNNFSIGFFSVIRGKKIKINNFVKIGSTSIIDTERIEIDDDAKINEQVFIGGPTDPESYIRIGKRTIIMQMSFLNPTKPLIIGDDTGIGGHCLIFTHGSWLSQIDGYPVTFSPVTLGERVWLPWRVFVMPGVTIGNDVVIGANSLVSKDLPSNCLAAGSPAKIINDAYPPKLSDEKRDAIINDIFSDFIKYLTYFNIEPDFENSSNTKKLTVKKNQVLFYSKNGKIEPVKEKYSIIVFDNDEKDIKKYLEASDMVVNIKVKSRVGTSDLGEEFVNYIARYGVRLERIN